LKQFGSKQLRLQKIHAATNFLQKHHVALNAGIDPTFLAEISSARASQLLMELGGATYVGTSVVGAPKFLD
jgi:hypothetical protein